MLLSSGGAAGPRCTAALPLAGLGDKRDAGISLVPQGPHAETGEGSEGSKPRPFISGSIQDLH